MRNKVIHIASIETHGIVSPKAFECMLYAEREGLAADNALKNLVRTFGLDLILELVADLIASPKGIQLVMRNFRDAQGTKVFEVINMKNNKQVFQSENIMDCIEYMKRAQKAYDIAREA